MGRAARRGVARAAGPLGPGRRGGGNAGAGATWARNSPAEGGRVFPFSFSDFYFTFPFSIFFFLFPFLLIQQLAK
jgi:hypothetical protein